MVLSDTHPRIAAIHCLLLKLESLSTKTDGSIQLVTSRRETRGLVPPCLEWLLQQLAASSRGARS